MTVRPVSKAELAVAKCRCGLGFAFVAEIADGRRLFYWCWECDVPRSKRR